MEFFLNRSSFALFVALLIHLVLILLFWILGSITPEIKKTKKEENKIKISLKEMPKKAKEQGFEKIKQTPPPEIAPPMPKGSQLKEIVKQPLMNYDVQKPTKKTTLNEPKEPQTKPEPTPKTEPLPPTKPYIPLLTKTEDVNTTEKKEPKNPMAWLNEDRTAQEVEQNKQKTTAGSNISSDIKELYGDTFGKLTPGQQQYILDNQEIMRRITQQVLNRVARVNLTNDLNVNRRNMIEFYLHPNGDMTDFRFLSKSGYYVLDDTTKETIEYAYSRYPRPAEKTLIRYVVYYNLARY